MPHTLLDGGPFGFNRDIYSETKLELRFTVILTQCDGKTLDLFVEEAA